MIYVTGFFGAPIMATAEKIAKEKGLPLIDLDGEIQAKDGRTIKRLVMMHGEHGYRNQEFEMLSMLEQNHGSSGAVVACGDGVLHDEDSREIISRGQLVVVGDDIPADELWANACEMTETYHAFMSFGNAEEKRAKFDELIERQKILFGGMK